MFVNNKTVKQPVTNIGPVLAASLPISPGVNHRRVSLGHSVLLPEKGTGGVRKRLAANLAQTQTVQINQRHYHCVRCRGTYHET
jgi:hypothetical protein